MSLFQQSAKIVSAVLAEIADSAGASADTEMLARAQKSYNAAIGHFNNKANWNFVLTEATPIGTFAPFTVTGISASAGQTTASAVAGHGFAVDDFLAGSGISPGVRVSATATNSIGFALPVTGFSAGVTVVTLSGERDMYSLPTDWKAPYSARLLGAQRALRIVGRRIYDRSITNEQDQSSTWWYDVFMFGSKGKIRMLPPPSSSDILQLRYYRRMASATSISDTASADIHQDYDQYLVAYAKWHFLTDKGEGRGEQAKTWFTMAQEGLAMMLRDQTKVPDEDLQFVPGHFGYGNLGDNVTRGIPWSYMDY